MGFTRRGYARQFMLLPLASVCALVLPVAQGIQGQCDSTKETDSGGDTCSYYDSRPFHCGCCDTSVFSASRCCACQQSAAGGNSTWWTYVFQTWPRKSRTLRLPDKGIQGSLPGDFAERWPQLTEIDLSGNELVGSIPPGLGKLAKLERLRLESNHLTGSIPPDLGGLASVVDISLARNQLAGSVPAELGNLSRIEVLLLDNNRLHGGIPAELGNLSRIQWLTLFTNSLHGGIPAELGNLTSLKRLELDKNQLSGTIPAELGSLTSLQLLHLYSNQLSGTVPTELGNLGSLEDLRLYNNQLSGTIPAELGNLTSLRSLALHNNQLRGTIPAELGTLGSLVYLYLDGNQLWGTIPAELGNLGNLETLFLQINLLTGSIPAELGNLSRLGFLSLRDNRLSGGIPVELSHLGRLRHLLLYNNQLSGHIPAELGDLTSLDRLYLQDNQLSGTIPAKLGNLTALTELGLSSNHLSGRLPSELGNLGSLEILGLSENQLVGELPAELGDLVSLQKLVLSGNSFSGPVPPQLARLTSLQVLQLQSNKLSGTLPPELGSLASLRELMLQDNQLSGALPAELWNLQSLDYLHLGDNRLSGSLPPGLGSLTSLWGLYLNNNQFSGGIPAGLGRLLGLVRLNLQGNQLSGEVPSELGKLTRLTELNLAGNQLNGSLPSSFRGLQLLKNLRLSQNRRLCGGAEVITELASLVHLDLRACCFQDFVALPANLLVLDLGENLLTEVPSQWRGTTTSAFSLKELRLDGNRIERWDTSAVLPLTYFSAGRWLCGELFPGPRLPWGQLETLDVSGNPLNTQVYNFLASLSHLEHLSSLRAQEAGLLGTLPDLSPYRFVPYVPELDCDSESPNPALPGFEALLTLDLSGNGITAVLTSPSGRMVQADFSRNKLTALSSQWWQGGVEDLLQRVDVRNNPRLQLPVEGRPIASGACPEDGTDHLQANILGWNEINGTAECTTLCKLRKTRLLVDATANESVLCRCTEGRGLGWDCRPCPMDTYSTMSFMNGTYIRLCQKCPPKSILRGRAGACFGDCGCIAGHFMVHGRNGSWEDVGATLCSGLAPESNCSACGLFKTSLEGSRRASDCFCNSNASDGGWEGLLQRQGHCGCPEGEHVNFAERKCERCLPEEDCGDFAQSLEPPKVKAGFWALAPPPKGIDETFGNFSRHSIWRCEGTNTCPGNFSKCGLNRTGTACSLCKQGHFRTPSGLCVRCPRSHTEARRFLAGLFLASMPFPFVAHLLLTSDSGTRGTLELCLALRSLRTSAKQLLKFGQVLGVISLFSVEWPPLALSVFAVFRTLSLEFISWVGVACLNKGQQQTVTSELLFRWMLVPIGAVVTGLTALVVTTSASLLVPLCARCCPHGQLRMRQILRFQPSDVLRLLLFLLHLFFLAILKNALLPLTCAPSPNGPLTMTAYPHLVCWDSAGTSSEGEGFWSLAVPGLIQSAILALAFPLLICTVRKRIEPLSLESDQRRLWWDFVFGDFRLHHLSWALVALCKDILLSLVAVLLPGLGTAQLLLTAVISAAYACQAFCTSPYTDFSNTLLEACTSGAVAALCLFSAGMGFQSEPEVPDLGEYIAGGREGQSYLQRGIALASLQGLSLAGPFAIIVFQLLMAFPRCRRRVPARLKPFSAEDWTAWIQKFETGMRLGGSRLRGTLESLDSVHAADFRRALGSHPDVRSSMRLPSSSAPSDQQTGGMGEVEELKAQVAALKQALGLENKALSLENEALPKENGALSKENVEAQSLPHSPQEGHAETECEAGAPPPRIRTSL